MTKVAAPVSVQIPFSIPCFRRRESTPPLPGRVLDGIINLAERPIGAHKKEFYYDPATHKYGVIDLPDNPEEKSSSRIVKLAVKIALLVLQPLLLIVKLFHRVFLLSPASLQTGPQSPREVKGDKRPETPIEQSSFTPLKVTQLHKENPYQTHFDVVSLLREALTSASEKAKDPRAYWTLALFHLMRSAQPADTCGGVLTGKLDGNRGCARLRWGGVIVQDYNPDLHKEYGHVDPFSSESYHATPVRLAAQLKGLSSDDLTALKQALIDQERPERADLQQAFDDVEKLSLALYSRYGEALKIDCAVDAPLTDAPPLAQFADWQKECTSFTDVATHCLKKACEEYLPKQGYPNKKQVEQVMASVLSQLLASSVQGKGEKSLWLSPWVELKFNFPADNPYRISENPLTGTSDTGLQLINSHFWNLWEALGSKPPSQSEAQNLEAALVNLATSYSDDLPAEWKPLPGWNLSPDCYKRGFELVHYLLPNWHGMISPYVHEEEELSRPSKPPEPPKIQEEEEVKLPVDKVVKDVPSAKMSDSVKARFSEYSNDHDCGDCCPAALIWSAIASGVELHPEIEAALSSEITKGSFPAPGYYGKRPRIDKAIDLARKRMAKHLTDNPNLLLPYLRVKRGYLEVDDSHHIMGEHKKVDPEPITNGLFEKWPELNPKNPTKFYEDLENFHHTYQSFRDEGTILADGSSLECEDTITFLEKHNRLVARYADNIRVTNSPSPYGGGNQRKTGNWFGPLEIELFAKSCFPNPEGMTVGVYYEKENGLLGEDGRLYPSCYNLSQLNQADPYGAKSMLYIKLAGCSYYPLKPLNEKEPGKPPAS